jgi:lipoprotein-anchoring transpeptidase ErfK/SrfK
VKTLLLALAFALAVTSAPAHAGSVTARIDISEQKMRVYVNGFPRYTWTVSTGRKGYRTPTGTFRAQRLARSWYSRKYDNAPMPHSIFFKGGYAIHGTTHVSSLGRPASHGCVRLAPGNAAVLFDLVRQMGPANMRVVVTQ